MLNKKLIITLICAATCGAVLFANFGPLKVARGRVAEAPPGLTDRLPSGGAGVTPQSPVDIQQGLGAIVTAVRPAVVNIAAHPAGAMGPPPPGMQILEPFPGRSSWVGSGVVVSPSGYVLTSRHVIGNADVARVQLFRSGNNSFLAHRVATDIDTDLVLLKLPFNGSMPYAVLGDSSRVRTGDLVIALGSPFGLAESATQGIVSASRRTVLAEGKTYKDAIQTDASINQGNCGGPLVDIRAQVIGINMAIYSTNSTFAGIGFAVRSNQARAFIQRATGLVR